jgi:hypothetical protein
MRMIILVLLVFLVATVGQAGWLNPSQPGFVIQTFTSYQPISGNTSGLILTNGISYLVAGDNTGTIYIGGPGAQFRGKNDGNLLVDGAGAFVLGSFPSLTAVTNRGVGSLLLGSLSAGQKALITEVGNASLLLGAGTVSNNQCIVVGDGNESHGLRSVTADSFWAKTAMRVNAGPVLAHYADAAVVCGSGQPMGLIFSDTPTPVEGAGSYIASIGNALYLNSSGAEKIYFGVDGTQMAEFTQDGGGKGLFNFFTGNV